MSLSISCVAGTAEVEAAIEKVDEVSEAAVVGFPHPVKGEGIAVFVVLREGESPREHLTRQDESVRH